MKSFIIVLMFCLFAAFDTEAQLLNEGAAKSDSVSTPLIELHPAKLYVHRPEDSRFIIERVSVLNRGGSPLKISRIKGSCYCSTGKILATTVYPMTTGEIELTVNLDGMGEGEDTVQFLIYSNAENSPKAYNLKILPPEDPADSTDTKD